MLPQLISTTSSNPEIYIHEYNNLSSVHKLKEDSLNDKHFRMFYKDKKPIAGYVLNKNNCSQYMEALPPEVRSAFLKKHKEHSIAEVTGMWYRSEFFSIYFMCYFYTRVSLDCILSGKKYILGGSHIKHVKDLHMKLLPGLIYNGHRYFGKSYKEYWVYYGLSAGIIPRIPGAYRHIIKSGTRQPGVRLRKETS